MVSYVRGLKGTMSEAELYWMRLRLQGGKLSKARRGKLFQMPPSGYQWDEAMSRFRFDPDEQAQRAIRLVFERFRLDGSGCAVVRYFVHKGLKMPVRDAFTHDLRWVPPSHGSVLRILHSPVYAGTYVFGRREERMALVDGQLRRRHVTHISQDGWKVCLPDSHPAYISWEEFMANQKKLRANCTNHRSPDKRGAAREGHALLQGLALCGRCGHRMSTNYQGTLPRASYECRSGITHVGDKKICWSVAARAIDEEVAKLFLNAMRPPEIELSLAVTREAERQAGEVDQQWKLRLDRIRYESRLAERRYKAVDPDNRVVAQTLEREWNDKLRELAEVEREHQEVRQRQKVVLTDEDRARILALAKDLPRVWRAESTTHAERKNLLRMLVREVTLTPVECPERMTRVQVLWQTGAVEDFTVGRPSNLEASATPPKALELIQKLFAEKKSDSEIVAELNRHGMLSGARRQWNAKALRWVRSRVLHLRRLPKSHEGHLPHRRADGLYSVHGLAERFGVTDHIVRYWVEKGWLQVTEGGGPGRPAWFKLDRETTERLKLARASGYGPGGRGRKLSRNHSQTRVLNRGHHG